MNSIRDHIIYQDHHLVVCNKPAGIPVQEDLTKDVSLHRMVQAYCKHDLYLCHRIDRPVSGLVIFAKNKESVIEINDQLIQKKFFKEYLAIVEKKELSATGTLVNHLVKSSKLKKSFVNEKSEGDESILNYKVLHEMDRYLVLNIELVTGRFHQIRSQLAHIGLPVKGDVKYGARRGNKDRTIGLHAWKAAFLHPSTKIQLNFEASLPINDIWPIVQQLLITI
ncbi:MAG: RluA family pseudouridine synthase [Saprospiraceae bacterium]|nr:RluA family pseudouridine synthase [Saprospiraceae bacterium]MBK9727311.1 RluA family pseudouridine synthase [Saprospiraceae bacterium]